ncbi:thioesterase family protein [Hyphomicrobium sp.]|uniref:thioesterase family protein n=1 Tax=Hyphomicrobium sp. TaxID=82 RepID=UPI002BB699A0|nr:thioesterase family protein [Hyphomicrobium sp.]HRN87574.1 thioesterase family protein [Hyphomicrobium sp.]HRQ26522.1 thioesterase family protein [Hyphomicrobium sp.]
MAASDRSADLTPGLQGCAETVVTRALTAATLGSGTVDVYGSPAMIALMEAAAVAAIEKHLGPGETTLGIHLDVNHKAATPIGLTVSATATLVAVDGRKLTFEIEAHDSKERIGEARHTRVIVDRARFEAKANAKAAST